MKKSLCYLLFAFTVLYAVGQNRAPSLWFNHADHTQGRLIMTDVRVPQGENPQTTYYSTLNFNSGAEMGGYAGIQNHDGQGNIFIFSIWDPIASNEAIKADYAAPDVEVANFGGEGTGLRSKHLTYNWKVGQWYKQVLRSWQYGNHTFVGYFLFDYEKNEWTHFVTMDFPVSNCSFSGSTGSFLENWHPLAGHDGNYSRTMHLRNGYKRDLNNNWVAFNRPNFYRVSPDAGASNFINKFNAGVVDDYLFMKAGGNTTPSITSGTTVTIAMPSSPSLTVGEILSVFPSFNKVNKQFSLSWVNNKAKSPQLSYRLDLYDNESLSGTPIRTVSDIKPHVFSLSENLSLLPDGKYYAKFQMQDIFDQASNVKTFSFSIGNTALAYDLSLDMLSFKPTFCNNPLVVEVSAINNGTQTINQFNLLVYANHQLVHTENVQQTLSSGQSARLTIHTAYTAFMENDFIEVEAVLTPSDENGLDNKVIGLVPEAFIPQENIIVHSYTTEELTGEGSNNGRIGHAFDGNSDTYWHSKWTGSGAAMPYEIVLDVSSFHQFGQILWENRANNGNGYAKNVEISAGDNPQNWSSSSAFQLANTSAVQTLDVSQLSGKFLKIKLLSNQSGSNDVAAIAELNIKGCVVDPLVTDIHRSELKNGNLPDAYPNPTTEKIYVHGLGTETSYELYTTTGQKIMDGYYTENGIDLSPFAKGVYLLKTPLHVFKVILE